MANANATGDALILQLARGCAASLFSVRISVRRSIIPGEVGAWYADGRWGRRRARAHECAALATAEAAYDLLLREPRVKMHIGAGGGLLWRVGARTLTIQWELRPNRVWRIGRLFLRCPACSLRATRLYLARDDAPSAACRSCLELSYESRCWNYKNVGLLRALGLSSRDFALRETSLKRESARAAARARAMRRRELQHRLTGARPICPPPAGDQPERAGHPRGLN